MFCAWITFKLVGGTQIFGDVTPIKLLGYYILYYTWIYWLILMIFFLQNYEGILLQYINETHQHFSLDSLKSFKCNA